MKHITLLILVSAMSLPGCVQKVYNRTVVLTLLVQGKAGIKEVGIRGNGNPLSWEKDFPMQTVQADSLYTATISARTAQKWAEIKFTVDGTFELREQPNRKLVFSTSSDTTYYQAVFDVAPVTEAAVPMHQLPLAFFPFY